MPISEIAQKALEALEKSGCARPTVSASDAGPAAKSYTFSYEGRHADPYWQAAMVAWRRIAEHACLPGAMRWVESRDPALHHELIEELPRQIDRLWDTEAPLPRFQSVLNQWVQTHQKAVDLYLAARRTRNMEEQSTTTPFQKAQPQGRNRCQNSEK